MVTAQGFSMRMTHRLFMLKMNGRSIFIFLAKETRHDS